MVVSSETSRGLVGRLLPLSGAAFVILILANVLVLGSDTPDSDSSAASVASYYKAHESREVVGAFIFAATVPLILFFGASLALASWPTAAGRRPVWQVVLAAGSALTALAFLVAATIHFALADAADTVTASTLQGINVIDGDIWILFNSALGVMMLGAAGSLIPSAKPYRLLGWIALVLGIALFIPFADFFALLLTGIWIIAVSIMLYRRQPALA
jgi:hypothetical protein